MNPINELTRVVEEAKDAEDAAERMAELFLESGCPPGLLEQAVDSVRRAFRKHIESRGGDPPAVSCSFCAKSEDEVANLVVASTAAICGECVTLAGDVVGGRAKKARSSGLQLFTDRILRR